jgi:RNA polymerase sigma factor (TIGR02999 family)
MTRAKPDSFALITEWAHRNSHPAVNFFGVVLAGANSGAARKFPVTLTSSDGENFPAGRPDCRFRGRLGSSGGYGRGVNEITRQLEGIAGGDKGAGERLIELVYTELRRMAAQRLSANHANQTLQPTALVHEVWLRLGGEELRGWNNRGHFFAAAATAMRSILVDHARHRQALRHGGGQERVALDHIELADGSACDEQVLAVHEVLEKFAAEEPQKAELVKLRYFAGLSVEESAQVLGVSEATIHRWWVYSRAWLGREIKL